MSTISTPTLRLPKPPPPPKPLHLTIRNSTASLLEPSVPDSSRSSLPNEWLQTASVDPVITSDAEEEEEMPTWLTAHSGASDGGGSTVRRKSRRNRSRSRSENKRALRKSIFFDPRLENPLVPPTPASPGDEQGAVGQELEERDEASTSTATASETSSDEINVTGQSNKLSHAEVLQSNSAAAQDPPPSFPPTAPASEPEPELFLPGTPQTALALHPFEGESAFGELSFRMGERLMIEVEDLGGNWSLGYVARPGEEPGEGDEGRDRGLIPRGWYAFVIEEEDEDEDEDEGVHQVPTNRNDESPTLSFHQQPSPVAPHESELPSIKTDIPASPPLPDTPTALTPMSTSSLGIPSPLAPLPSPQISPAIEACRDLPTVDSSATVAGREEHGSDEVGRGDIGGGQTQLGAEVEDPTLYELEPITDRSTDLVLHEDPPDSKPPSLPSQPAHRIPSPPLLSASADEPLLQHIPLPSPSLSLSSITSSTALPSPTPSSILRSRSIGRHVVVSGVTFEPLLDHAEPTEVGEGRTVEELLADFEGDGNKTERLESLKESVEQGAEVGEEADDEDARARRWSEAVQQADRESMFHCPQGGESYFPSHYGSGAEEGGSEEARGGVEGAEEEQIEVVENEAVLPVSTPPGPSPKVDEPFSPRPLERLPTPPPPPNDEDIQGDSDPSSVPTSGSVFARMGLTRSSISTAAAGGASRGGAGKGASRVKARSPVEMWIMEAENGTSREEKKEHVKHGSEEREDSEGFYVEAGPQWRPTAPSFTVHVHSPSKRQSYSSTATYTTFHLTTIFPSSTSPEEQLTVERRYSHFVRLHQLLSLRYPILVIPALPGKHYFSDADVEVRRRDLERWLGRVGRHPVLRGSEEVRAFLSAETDADLRHLLCPTSPPVASAFLSQVSHPAFNLDLEDAQELGERFGTYARAVEVSRGVKHVEEDVMRIRHSYSDAAEQSKVFTHHLASFIGGQVLPPAGKGYDGVSTQDQAKALGLQNSEGATTWKEGCSDSLSTAKAVQAAAEGLAAVSSLTDVHARESLLPVQELLLELSHPESQHSMLLQTHRALVALHPSFTSDEAIARCETALNATAAEIERAYAERNEDLRTAIAQYLDAEVLLHTQALENLSFARSHFDPDLFDSLSRTGPRLRSLLERPPPPPVPLPQPSTYGVPSTTLGSVSEALSAGVGSALGIGRTSAPVVFETRASATAGTVGRSAAELLQGQGRSGSSTLARSATWRESIFGTGRMW